MNTSRIFHLLATDAQRAYLRRLYQQAFASRIDTGMRDSRRFCESDRLLKQEANAEIKRLKMLLERRAA